VDMPRDKILVITSKDDSHADYVISKLNSAQLDDRVVRLNTEDFLFNCEVFFDGSQFELYIRDSKRRLRSSEVCSVWYRRPKEITTPGDSDPGVNAFISGQATSCLRGLYFCLHDSALWINPLPALHRSRLKLQQLQLAESLGLRIPRTLVTNLPSRALEFAAKVGSVCVKSLDEPSCIVEGRLYPFFTSLVSLDDLRANADAIRTCPVLFQEYIDKEIDVRVIVMGEELFAFEIHSQDCDLSKIDFRGVAPDRIHHAQHSLPWPLRESLLRFTRQQGLVFSAMDLVRTRAGEYFFLENNPNGQWLWLELLTSVRLSDALLRLLLAGCNRPRPHSTVEVTNCSESK
jgi:glutathione synthase/RimK-type ligase-like ATP-grasp enzyme